MGDDLTLKSDDDLETEGDLVTGPEPRKEAADAIGADMHPTTRLALELMAARIRPGDRVLDLGTDSGIFALAAARLGARSVLALDLDRAAVTAAHRNVVRNGLAGVVTVREGSLDSAVDPPYDLLLANMGAPALLDLT